MRRPRSARLVAAAALAVATLAASAVAGTPAGAVSDRARQPALDYAGESTLAAGMTYQGTVVGGLSSITYDADRDVYYALSDASVGFTGTGPYRFYTLRIDLADGTLDAGDVAVMAVTTLKQADGTAFPVGSLDPEGLALTSRGTLVLSSEGYTTPKAVPPRLVELGLDGVMLRELPLPPSTAPVPGGGVRNNLGIEAVAVTPDGRHLLAGFENALVQDGPTSTLTTSSASRLLDIDLAHGDVENEYVYRDDPVAEAPVPAGAFTVNGLVELLPFNARFGLAMERSFSVGAGNTIRLYRYATAGADDVSGVDALDGAAVREVDKTLVLDLDELVDSEGLVLDNLEGLTLGPRLPDGGRAVLLVSDNNFTPGQVSQFLLFSAHRVGPAA